MPRLVTSLYEGFVEYEWDPERGRLTEHLEAYQTARARANGWMLGPVVVPDARVVEVPPGIPVVGRGSDEGDLHIEARPLAAVELQSQPADVTATAERLLAFAPVVYFELEDASYADVVAVVDEMRGRGGDVRLRVYGVENGSNRFASVKAMARLLIACLARHVPLKVYGGTHRAFFGEHGHGYINLLAAVRVGLSGASSLLETCLADGDPGHFDIPTATWNGVGSEVHAGVLRQVLRSIGTDDYAASLAALDDQDVRNAWVA